MAENRNQGQDLNQGNRRQREDDQDLGNRIDRDRTQARERGGERSGEGRDDRAQGGQSGRMDETGRDTLRDEDDDDLGSMR